MQTESRLKEKFLFIKKFVTEPRTIGSVTPSSPHLVSSMLADADWRKVKSIAELGAGTGVMTREIIKRKRRETPLFVFEVENELRRMLATETGMEIYDDARYLTGVLKKNNLSSVDLIVSSLPYTVIPHSVTVDVLNAISESLSSNGLFVAFQYSLHMLGNFKKLFADVHVKFVMLNIPPAFVYVCRKPKRTKVS